MPRPRSVYASVALIVSSMVVALIRDSKIPVGPRMQELQAVLIAWQLLLLAMTLFIGLQLARGRNWARYVLLVFTAFEVMNLANAWVVSRPLGVIVAVDLGAVLQYALPTLLDAAALCLLFGPAQSWFRPRN